MVFPKNALLSTETQGVFQLFVLTIMSLAVVLVFVAAPYECHSLESTDRLTYQLLLYVYYATHETMVYW